MSTKEIFRCVYGSQLFGTSTPDSDEDFRSVVLPSRDNVLLGRANQIVQTESRERANVAGDVDRTDLTVQAFLGLLQKSEVTAIETLFATPVFFTPEWEKIYARRHDLVSANVQKFVGFSKSQVMRYGGRGQDVAAALDVLKVLDGIEGNRTAPASQPDIMAELEALTQTHQSLKLHTDTNHPTVEVLTLSGRSAQLTQGVKDVRAVYQKYIDRAGARSLAAAGRADKADLKGLYHAVRILHQALEILNTGQLVFPLVSAPELLRIRAGEVSTESCIERCDELTAEINAAAAHTALPEEVNAILIRELVLDVHESIVLSQPTPDERISP